MDGAGTEESHGDTLRYRQDLRKPGWEPRLPISFGDEFGRQAKRAHTSVSECARGRPLSVSRQAKPNRLSYPRLSVWLNVGRPSPALSRLRLKTPKPVIVPLSVEDYWRGFRIEAGGAIPIGQGTTFSFYTFVPDSSAAGCFHKSRVTRRTAGSQPVVARAYLMFVLSNGCLERPPLSMLRQPGLPLLSYQ